MKNNGLTNKTNAGNMLAVKLIAGGLLVISMILAVMPVFSIGGTDFGIIGLLKGVDTYMLMSIDPMPFALAVFIPSVLAFIINLFKGIPQKISAAFISALMIIEIALWIVLEQYLSKLCRDYFSEYVDAMDTTFFFTAELIVSAAVIILSFLIIFGVTKVRIVEEASSDNNSADMIGEIENALRETVNEDCKEKKRFFRKPARPERKQSAPEDSQNVINQPSNKQNENTGRRIICGEALATIIFGLIAVILGIVFLDETVVLWSSYDGTADAARDHVLMYLNNDMAGFQAVAIGAFIILGSIPNIFRTIHGDQKISIPAVIISVTGLLFIFVGIMIAFDNISLMNFSYEEIEDWSILAWRRDWQTRNNMMLHGGMIIALMGAAITSTGIWHIRKECA